jgi:cytochrome c oxidase subunit 2
MARRWLAVPLLALVAGLGAGCGGDEPTAPPAGEGEELVGRLGCRSCHSTDGSSGSGPTWQGLAGSDVRLDDGRVVTADRDYLIRSILEPDAETVDGYPAGLMASAVPDGRVSPAEAEAIAAYIEGLAGN